MTTFERAGGRKIKMYFNSNSGFDLDTAGHEFISQWCYFQIYNIFSSVFFFNQNILTYPFSFELDLETHFRRNPSKRALSKKHPSRSPRKLRKNKDITHLGEEVVVNFHVSIGEQLGEQN